MLNLLKSAYNLFTKGLSAVYHWVLNAIAVVYTYVNKLFDELGKEVVSVAHSLTSFAHSVSVWVTQAIDNLIKDIESTGRSIISWATGLLNDLRNYAISVYQWAARTFDSIIKSIAAAVSYLEKWIIQDIYDPLYNFAKKLENWVLTEGAWLYDLVSHPDKLVAWIARYLLSAWLTIIKTWGVPVAKFIMSQWKKFEPDLVSILEDIISKVL